MNDTVAGWSIGSAIGWVVIFLICLSLFGCPKWKVWQQGLLGEAELARATQNRQIKINEAKAKKDAAVYIAQADSIRAIGTSNANKIIANSLTEEYIRWLFVDQLDQTQNQVIYIPTEGNIPIMEATRNLP